MKDFQILLNKLINKYFDSIETVVIYHWEILKMALLPISESVALKGINKAIDVTKVVILLKKAKYGPKDNNPVSTWRRQLCVFKWLGIEKTPMAELTLEGEAWQCCTNRYRLWNSPVIVLPSSKVKNGGYKIAYSIPKRGKSPIAFSEGPYRVLLGHNSTTRALDVTNRSRRDVLDAAKHR